MSEYVPFNNFSSNMSKATAAADLHRTPVHQGLGTSAVDPYERTLPNVPTAPPASTVTHSHEVAAFSATEVEQIHKRWGRWGFGLMNSIPVFLYICKSSSSPTPPLFPPRRSKR
ncbi:hypothetical protein AGDE_13157 [Angomonas deanei]|uniref:Uncharacterized protein n=1 Tax=Angomonas deanei TaxID=59799 RepID=A0A7G2C6X3_9TRYP|nr:hypothetical protein AGDE_13157 [Angomonas deanei]CAD2215560.1 hypothetical protein, conserved [Angomonas deanei]|eukprot:EPY22697.1 hypothetical protein AGDE_13157 [Angomonas deanei]